MSVISKTFMNTKKSILFIESSILLVSLAILPLFPSITFIATKIMMPLLLVVYLIKYPLKSVFQPFICLLIFMVIYGVFCGIFVSDLNLFFEDMSAVLITLIYSMIIFQYCSKAKNNKIIICNIFIMKFIFIIVYGAMNFDTLMIYLINNQRLKTGLELGINANAFGYFGFIAMFAAIFNYIYSGRKKYLYVFFVVSTISLISTFLVSSRGGMLFTIIALILLSNIVLKGLFIKTLNISAVYFLIYKSYDIFIESNIFQRLQGVNQLDEDLRYKLIYESLDRIFTRPLGHGPGQFAYYDSHNGVSHNSIIYLAHDYGFVFVLFAVVIKLIWLKDIFKSKNSISKEAYLTNLTFLILLIAYSNLYIFYNNAYIYSFIMLIAIFFKTYNTKLKLK